MLLMPTDEERALFEGLLKDVTEIKTGMRELRDLLTARNPRPDPETIWPYGNWENCKYTFPDASEIPALQIRRADFQSPYIRFAPDGSIRFDLPEGTAGKPTPSAQYLRIERREYKDMSAKTDFVQGDIIKRDFLVVFHALNRGVSDVVFTQIHGNPDPYFKVAAGKKGIRVLCKTREGLSGDDVIRELLPHEALEYERPYRYRCLFDGTNLEIGIDNNRLGVVFERRDPCYPKDGAYSPLGVSLTHRPVTVLNA
ncbi:MAG: hypothetical protein KDI90_06165 [Alphaproteobacteria bacterium]|nr:hypothetical protein [Alphaproteobacteria bacterium]MCB9975797.1 hypothetical protein [Rhodospirillales bacterium]